MWFSFLAVLTFQAKPIFLSIVREGGDLLLIVTAILSLVAQPFHTFFPIVNLETINQMYDQLLSGIISPESFLQSPVLPTSHEAMNFSFPK